MSSHRGIVSLSRHRRAGCWAHGAKSFGRCGQVCGVRGNFRVNVPVAPGASFGDNPKQNPGSEALPGTHVRAGLWGASVDAGREQETPVPRGGGTGLCSSPRVRLRYPWRSRGPRDPELLPLFTAGEGHCGIGITFSSGMRQGISPGLWGRRRERQCGGAGSSRRREGLRRRNSPESEWRVREAGSDSPVAGRGPGFPGREPRMSALLSRGLQSLPGGSLLSGSSLSLWCEELPRHQLVLRDAVPDARGIIRLCISDSFGERGVPGLLWCFFGCRDS